MKTDNEIFSELGSGLDIAKAHGTPGMPGSYVGVGHARLFATTRAVQEIAGGPVKRWLDKELPAIRNTRADLIGETISGEVVHLEFMSENQKLFELRMAGYYVEIYQSWARHPHQVSTDDPGAILAAHPILQDGGTSTGNTATLSSIQFRMQVHGMIVVPI